MAKLLNTIALTLVIAGAVNWGLVAFFNFDLVAAILAWKSGKQRSHPCRLRAGRSGRPVGHRSPLHPRDGQARRHRPDLTRTNDLVGRCGSVGRRRDPRRVDDLPIGRFSRPRLIA